MKKIIVIGLVIAVLAAAVVLLTWQSSENDSVEINSFEDCLAAGYPVLESLPRQCKTPDGKTFFEETAPNTNGRNYVSESVEQCATVRFICEEGKQAFFDESGCGCETVDERRTYCDAQSREGEVCPEYYAPVCGWFSENIQCIKYPCAQTYSNGCFACHDDNVAYLTQGECPT